MGRLFGYLSKQTLANLASLELICVAPILTRSRVFTIQTNERAWPVTNASKRGNVQGCQMVYFQTKNPNLGILWRASERKILVYFKAIWNIFRPFGICFGHLEILVHFPLFW
jgi:hypothetical protein